MEKLTILAAVLVALVALGEVSAHRTTITTTTIEEEDTNQSQKCREQMQRQQQLSHCQMYLSPRRGPYELELRNPQQQHLRQCCQQLENMDEQCRCEAIRQMVRKQQQQERMQGEEMREMAQEAEYLPSKCNMGPQRCQIRAVWF